MCTMRHQIGHTATKHMHRPVYKWQENRFDATQAQRIDNVARLYHVHEKRRTGNVQNVHCDTGLFADDDVRFLEHDLAGEHSSYCDDNQRTGTRQK